MQPLARPSPANLQDIAARADKGAGWARDAKAYRADAIGERCGAVRDLRVARNRGAPLRCCVSQGCLCWPSGSAVLASSHCRTASNCISVCCRHAAGVLRAHERLARERNKQRDDDRTLRMEALKVRGVQPQRCCAVPPSCAWPPPMCHVAGLPPSLAEPPHPPYPLHPRTPLRRTTLRRTRRCSGSRRAQVPQALAASGTRPSAASWQASRVGGVPGVSWDPSVLCGARPLPAWATVL